MDPKENVEVEQEKQGLELLSDEVLAHLVETEQDAGGDLNRTGQRAFDELYRRDPNTGR